MIYTAPQGYIYVNIKDNMVFGYKVATKNDEEINDYILYTEETGLKIVEDAINLIQEQGDN